MSDAAEVVTDDLVIQDIIQKIFERVLDDKQRPPPHDAAQSQSSSTAVESSDVIVQVTHGYRPRANRIHNAYSRYETMYMQYMMIFYRYHNEV